MLCVSTGPRQTCFSASDVPRVLKWLSRNFLLSEVSIHANCSDLIFCKTVGAGKTRNIAFLLVCSNGAKQVARFCCPCFLAFKNRVLIVPLNFCICCRLVPPHACEKQGEKIRLVPWVLFHKTKKRKRKWTTTEFFCASFAFRNSIHMRELKHLALEALTRQVLNEVLTAVYSCIQAVIISLSPVLLWSFLYLEKP